MPRYNETFELSVEDMDLIEGALRQAKAELSLRAMPDAMEPDRADAATSEADETVRRIHDLLGRLHNQKVFYRPRRSAYISG